MEIKEILPNRKFVPPSKSIAETKVISSTGTSPNDLLVNKSTPTTTKATITLIFFISCSRISASWSPNSVDT